MRDGCTSGPNKTASGAQKNRMSLHCSASAPEIALSKHVNVSLTGRSLIAGVIADVSLAISLLISLAIR
jgi:hypothetical protein